MPRTLRSALPALLIMGLMAFVVVPKRWLHDCDTGFHTHTTAGTSVVEDGHCPLCDTVIPAPVLSVAGVLLIPAGRLEVVNASDGRRFLSASRLFRSVRGPPCLG